MALAAMNIALGALLSLVLIVVIAGITMLAKNALG